MALKTALTSTLLTWALTSSTPSVVADQLDLPGDYDKPGDPNALDTLMACGAATDELLLIPAISDSLAALHVSVLAFLNSDESCVSEGNDFVCSLDYSVLPTDYKTVCESNGGVYDESYRQVTCEAPNNPTTSGLVTYQFSNYPTCFSSACTSTDLERWIADEVDDFEISVEQDTSWVCDSDYELEETTASQSGSGTCPNRVNDSPEICGPLLESVSGQQCDCYAFCDGPNSCNVSNSEMKVPPISFARGKRSWDVTVPFFEEYAQKNSAGARCTLAFVVAAASLSSLVMVMDLMML